MSNLRLALTGVGVAVLIVVVAVLGYQLDWWLKGENTDRQVRIDNRNLGTQTAWADEATDLINQASLLPENHPSAAALERQACDLIGKLTDTYMTDDLAVFQSQECS